jgi:WD40 repeat protein
MAVAAELTDLSRLARAAWIWPLGRKRRGQRKLVSCAHANQVIAVAWSPNSKRLASLEMGCLLIHLWDARKGKLLRELAGHEGVVTAVSWSPNGKHLASTSYDRTLRIWAADTGRQRVRCQGSADGGASVAWSPDGTRVASAGIDHTVQVWAATGELVATYRGHSGRVRCVVWSPDGKHLASGSQDQTVRIWDARAGEPVRTYHDQSVGGHRGIEGLAWSPDGTRLAWLSRGKVHLWEIATGQKGHQYTPQVAVALSWSPDGQRIAIAQEEDDAVQVVAARTLEPLFTSRSHALPPHVVAWSPNGKAIASGSETIHIWPVAERAS